MARIRIFAKNSHSTLAPKDALTQTRKLFKNTPGRETMRFLAMLRDLPQKIALAEVTV